MSKLLIVGAGGVAQQIAQALLLHAEYQLETPEVVVYDGDVFEEDNSPRQFLARSKDNVGGNKATVFAAHFNGIYGGEITPVESYFYTELAFEHDPDDVIGIITMADNHAARVNSMEAAQVLNCPMISGANETDHGEAWVWRPGMDDKVNPFKRYPDIIKAGDRDNPLAAGGCATDDAFEDNPQIPLGNALTASAIMMVVSNNIGVDKFDGHEVVEARYMQNRWLTLSPTQILQCP